MVGFLQLLVLTTIYINYHFEMGSMVFRTLTNLFNYSKKENYYIQIIQNHKVWLAGTRIITSDINYYKSKNE